MTTLTEMLNDPGELLRLQNEIARLHVQLAACKRKSKERKAILESISVGDACGWCGTIQIFRRDDTERKPQHRDDCPLAKALED